MPVAYAGQLSLGARRYDEAIAQYHRALEMDAGFPEAHGPLGLTCSMVGRHGEAERELRQVKGLEENPMYLSWLVYVYGAAGRKEEGLRALGQLKDLSQRVHVSPFWMATAYTGLGEQDQAIRYFEQAFAEHTWGAAVTLKVNAVFDDLLRRANFKP